MKFLTLFFVLITTLVAGEILFSTNENISKREMKSPEVKQSSTPEQELVEETVSIPKRTLKRVEKVIEPVQPAERVMEPEVLAPDKSETIYYQNRKGDFFLPPSSLFDLRKIVGSSLQTPLYFGFQDTQLEKYSYPFRIPVDQNKVYYSEKKEDKTPRVLFVNVDSVNPEISSLQLDGKSYQKKETGKLYYSLGTELKVVAKDSDSGVKTIRVFDQNGIPIERTSALFEQEKNLSYTFSLNRDDTESIQIEVEDNVGNTTRSEKMQIMFDVRPPVVTLSVEPTQNGSERNNNLCALGSKIGATAKDNESEVTEIEYRYPNTDWKKYTGRLILNKPGIYRMEFRAKDFFGNTSLPEFLECRVF
jgi:hypothetical protein